MLVKRTIIAILAVVLVFGFVVMTPAAKATAQDKPTIAKVCLNCHKAEAGNLRGKFENAAFKSQSIQLQIDDSTEIIKFDPDTLKVVVQGKTEESEALREISKGHEVRIEYTEKAGKKFATLVSSKPPVSVPEDQLISTEEVMKLVAMGPEKGKYTLVDARPGPRFNEGAIPTAINIPDPAFDKFKDRLPAAKDALVIFYCGGVT